MCVCVCLHSQELKSGRDRLKREVSLSDSAPVKFMQDNLDAFLLCYQTLSDIPTAVVSGDSSPPLGHTLPGTHSLHCGG